MSWLKQNKILVPLAIIIVLSIPSIASLLNLGFFKSDDGEWMIIRFSAFHQAFRDGQFPVRFLGRLNNGYGYPVSNFLYPGFMYLAEPIHFLKFGFVDSIKIVFGLSMVSSSVFVYLWLIKVFDRFSSIIGALFYLYTPYHLYDIYNRGSIGEVLVLALVPFILWQIERKSAFWICTTTAFLIVSHNTLAILFLPVIFLYMILRGGKELSFRKKICNDISLLILAFGLSAFFWIPAIGELPITKFSQIQVSDFKNYFVKVDLIGYSSLLVIYTSAFIFIYKLKIKKKPDISRMLFLFFMLLGFFGIMLSSKASLIFWNFFPSSILQFPFRLLSCLILSVSFLSAFIIHSVSSKKKIVFSIILMFILIYSAFPYIKPKEFFNKGEGFYSTNEGTTTVQNEYMPVWVKNIPAEHFKNKVETDNSKITINNLLYNSKLIKFDISSLGKTMVTVNTIYYPGWQAYVNGKAVDIQYSNNKGLMELSLGEGESRVELFFYENSLRLFADLISVTSLILLFILLNIKRFNKVRGN